MNRRTFLKSTAMSAAVGLLPAMEGCEPNAAGKRPNIILIIDDQHNSKAMGWTGMGDGVKTPALDKLASESVAFTNAYTPCPVCAPARHSLLTGLYSSSHGVVHNDRALGEEVSTIMEFLSQAGYTTANVGKLHFAPYNARHGFQYVINHEFYQDDGGISHFRPYLQQQVEKRGIQAERYPTWIHVDPPESWQARPEGLGFQYDLPKDLTGEHFITNQSIEFIKDQMQHRPDQPFFLHASYFAPHHPYGPVKEFGTYDPDEMVLPPSWTQERADQFMPELQAKYEIPGFTEADYKKLKALYFGYISQLDYEIGRLLAWVDSQPELAKNTIVLFMSDHGDLMGEHGRLFKNVMYEGSAAVPFMVRWPGTRPKKEQVVVSLLDVVPTLLAATDVESPSTLPGKDLKPLLATQKPDASWTDRTVFSEWLHPYLWGTIMARKGDYKLIAQTKGTPEKNQFPKFSYQLFNLVNDPWEMNNLAGNPDYESVLTDLKADIHEHWEQQHSHLPDQMPPTVPRSTWDIHWPPQPWKQVKAIQNHDK